MRGTTFIALALLTGVVASCKKDAETPPSRAFRMGFQNSAPRYDDFSLVLESLGKWTEYADAAIITTEVPWDSLYAGVSPVTYVSNNYSGLVSYYRQRGLKLWIYIDPQNGLDRTHDSRTLTALGKSIAQQEVQQVYRRFVVVMDSMLTPQHLGLALETNLIRLASPDSIYHGVRKAANDAATEVMANDPDVKISVSIQAEVAWGKLGGTGAYAGIAKDLDDFPFAQELGISSYPYFVYNSPADLPSDYYSKLQGSSGLPVFISEGGWPSVTFQGPNNQTIEGSGAEQQEYIVKQVELLDKVKAIGVFQLTFTDIDVSTLPVTVDPSIKYFAYLGMVDTNLLPKPAWTTWKEIFARKLNQDF